MVSPVRWACNSIDNRKAHGMLAFLLPPARLQSLLPGEAESGSAGTQPDEE